MGVLTLTVTYDDLSLLSRRLFANDIYCFDSPSLSLVTSRILHVCLLACLLAFILSFFLPTITGPGPCLSLMLEGVKRSTVTDI